MWGKNYDLFITVNYISCGGGLYVQIRYPSAMIDFLMNLLIDIHYKFHLQEAMGFDAMRAERIKNNPTTVIRQIAHSPNEEFQELNPKKQKGPSADILRACRRAMEEWLDNEKPLTISCNLAGGVAVKTVRKWIPFVLDDLQEDQRMRWIKRMKALGEEENLGKYRNV